MTAAEVWSIWPKFALTLVLALGFAYLSPICFFSSLPTQVLNNDFVHYYQLPKLPHSKFLALM